MLRCQIIGNIPSQWTKANSVKDVCQSLAYSSDFRRRASKKSQDFIQVESHSNTYTN